MLVFTALAALWCLAVNRPGHFGQLVVPWVIYGLASGPLVPVTLGTYKTQIILTPDYLPTSLHPLAPRACHSRYIHTLFYCRHSSNEYSLLNYYHLPHFYILPSLNPSLFAPFFHRSGSRDDLSDPCRQLRRPPLHRSHNRLLLRHHRAHRYR